ncbi:site-specific integrase [Denitromonas sp. IR12]|uniref:Site-specific integrase n=1 Tax=Denitromonas iodatirespirans TaxID=2795389 RepID=A0A944DHD3_DENI1|nr:site-specific integrase [Denitromonas iodatirespirans]MBT0962898.1 site-specific integrase [Denitromonas iodatirespirans]
MLSFAKAKKLRSGENPAIWRGHLDALLPKQGKDRARGPPRRTSLQQDVRLHARTACKKRGQGARTLEFTILTGSRSGEVRGMRWREVDWASGVWTIPAERMKGARTHRVPLSSRALELLNELPKGVADELVFPGERSGRPLSDMTLSAIIKRLPPSSEWIDARSGKLATQHGFRSSFRDRVAERTDYPHEMAEIALAHTIDNKVEAAYRRGDMLEKRREMMEAWCRWCAAK